MISFNDNVLNKDGRDIVLKHAILDATEVEGEFFVIFDHMEFPKNEVAKNLVKIDSKGKEIWTAENPTNLQTDAYTNFCGTEKPKEGTVTVNNFAGYYCEINMANGKLENAEFTK